jgi:hypothetical protein
VGALDNVPPQFIYRRSLDTCTQKSSSKLLIYTIPYLSPLTFVEKMGKDKRRGGWTLVYESGSRSAWRNPQSQPREDDLSNQEST